MVIVMIIDWLNIHWKDWCWSWSSNPLATWGEELTHWKRPCCWERLKAGGEGSYRGWDGLMSSSTPWTWTRANSRRQWRTGKSGVLQSIGSQRVRHDLRAEHQQQQINTCYLIFKGFPAGSAVENLPTNAGDFSSITGSERSPEEKNGCPSQYSCLGIPWTEEPGGPQSMVSQRKTCPSNWACMHLIFNKTWKTFKKAGEKYEFIVNRQSNQPN